MARSYIGLLGVQRVSTVLDQVARRRAGQMSHPWCVYSDQYYADMGDHIFPVEKYRRLYARLTATGVLGPDDVVPPQPACDEDILRVHEAAYIAHLRRLAALGWGYLTPDTPVTAEILEGAILSTGGTIVCGRLAMEIGISLHLSGGFHHAFPDHGEGFCYINDVAVAIRRLQADRLARRAAIIDADVHQGNANAAIFAGDSSVFTFSIHEEDNYPFPKPPSDLDIGLPWRCSDAEYLAGIRAGIEAVLTQTSPDIIFYLAGADPYEDDMLGGLGVTMEGLRLRDRLVISACREARVPLAIVLAGGYARDTNDTIAIHCHTAEEVKASLNAR